MNKNKFVYVLSDGPIANLKYVELLKEKPNDDGLNELITIGITVCIHSIEHFKIQKTLKTI